MNDAEVDSLVARLVPEFERCKFRAVEARYEYLAIIGLARVDRAAMSLAHARWQALEARCQEILDHIDQLAERNAA